MDGIYIAFDNRDVGIIWTPGGVPTESNRSFAIPPNKRGFEFFFEPILSRLEPLCWFAQGWQSSPFVAAIYEPGGEEKLNEFWIDHPRFYQVSASVFRAGVLPTLAPWLYDDWIDLIGFRCNEEDVCSVADGLYDADNRGRDAYYAAIDRKAELCFFCIDGFSWELYCHEPDVLEAVGDHVASIGHITVKRCRLNERDRVLFNDWKLGDESSD
ncbi:MAG: hypothetical protein ABFD16_26755 [Thermoguttaceae bacterium]|jgi:hypothetical protein